MQAINDDDAELLRLLRADGMGPTARERWTAFYRLWRLTRKGMWERLAVEDCFKVLMYDWRWINLVENPGDPLGTTPLFLRRLAVDPRERERLLADIRRA